MAQNRPGADAHRWTAMHLAGELVRAEVLAGWTELAEVLPVLAATLVKIFTNNEPAAIRTKITATQTTITDSRENQRLFGFGP